MAVYLNLDKLELPCSLVTLAVYMCLSDRVAQWTSAPPEKLISNVLGAQTSFSLHGKMRYISIIQVLLSKLTNYSSTQTEVSESGSRVVEMQILCILLYLQELRAVYTNFYPFTSTLLAWTKSLVLP